jgi:acetyl esterase/lipase
MAKSPELDAVITLASELGNYDDSQGAIEGFRRSLEALTARFSFDGSATYTRVNAGGVPAEWVAAEGCAEDRVLIYVHGGGYVIGSVRTHRVLMADLSRASGARVLGLDYRLAPEHPFPAPVEDTVSAYRWLLSEGFDPAKISVAGDSAGGGLTVAALVQIRYVGLPMAGAGVCISPWVDMEGTGDSVVSKAEEDPMVEKEGLVFMAGTYLAGADPRAPLAAPLYADLHELPPLLIQVGSAEILLDDANRLTERARKAGVEVELNVWEDMIHVWHMFAPILPEGQQAIAQAGEFIKKHTGG